MNGVKGTAEQRNFHTSELYNIFPLFASLISKVYGKNYGMRKIDFTLIADALFYAVAAWFLSIGLMRYYRMQLTLAVILASIIALAVASIFFLLSYASRRKRKLGKKESAARDALMLHLALEKEERINEALLTAFQADEKQVQLQGDTLLVEDALCVPRFTMQPLSADEVARILRAYGREKLTILCNELSPEAEKLAASFGVKVMKKNEIYALFTRTQTTPDPLILAELPRKSAKRTLRRIVSKKSARPFFTSGILLLLMSLFTFFPFYYLTVGCALTIFAILIRFFGFAPQNGDYV